MTRILKYPLPLRGPYVIPGVESVLAVGWQDEQPVLWAIAEDPAIVRAQTELDVLFTGDELPRYLVSYLGTAQGLVGGHLIVCHVFRKTGP